jgi:ATP-dependent DNA ligase
VREPYSKRRKILEQMRLDGPRWHTPEAFDDGQALCAAVCEHELEGIVVKRRVRSLPLRGPWLGEGEELLVLALRT